MTAPRRLARGPGGHERCSARSPIGRCAWRSMPTWPGSSARSSRGRSSSPHAIIAIRPAPRRGPRPPGPRRPPRILDPPITRMDPGWLTPPGLRPRPHPSAPQRARALRRPTLSSARALYGSAVRRTSVLPRRARSARRRPPPLARIVGPLPAPVPPPMRYASSPPPASVELEPDAWAGPRRRLPAATSGRCASGDTGHPRSRMIQTIPGKPFLFFDNRPARERAESVPRA